MQKVKKIKPDWSFIKYYPMVNDLVLTVGYQMHYDFESHQFDLNQDDHGEPDLVGIHHVALNDDFSQLSFEANYDGLPTQFVITPQYATEKILLETFEKINKSPISPGKDLDHIQFNFDKGKLEKIEIYKHDEEFEILDTLDIFLDKATKKNVLLIQDPYQKIELKSITINDNKLIARSADREYEFKLSAQPLIVDTLKKLLETAV